MDFLLYDEGFQWAVSQSEIDKRLDQVVASGARKYSPSVWLGDGTPYPSDVSPRSPRMKGTLASWDPYAYLKSEAARRNIRIYPNVLVNRRQPARYTEMRMNRDYTEVFNRLAVADFSEDYFDVRAPAFRTFLLSVLGEFIERYRPEFVVLDYIRTGGVCTSSACQEHYTAHSRRNLTIDVLSHPVNTAAKAAIQGWQEIPIRSLIETLRAENSRHVPTLQLLTTNSPHATDTIDNIQGRHTHAWLRSGLINQSIVMDYSEEPGFERVMNNRAIGLEEWIMIGNYQQVNGSMRPVPGATLKARLMRAQERYDEKVTLGIYIMNLLTPEQIAVLHDAATATTPKPPELLP